MKPIDCITSDNWRFIQDPIITKSGFREYDCRWLYPDQINLPGIFEVGRGIGTQIHKTGVKPEIVIGSDFREYSPSIRHALALGLIDAGISVVDIGTVITPVAYFARFHLQISSVAMVTASHNPNGWTGVKIGYSPPLTCNNSQMKQLSEIVLEGKAQSRNGGGYRTSPSLTQSYIEFLCKSVKITRKIKVICATGNGTASVAAPALLKYLGFEVIDHHTTPDYSFPNYNPDPESMVMLNDMAESVQKYSADLAFGFDGDGDRIGIVDNKGQILQADKAGLLIARHLASKHNNARFIVDVKSTGLFIDDPVLNSYGATVDYWKTGHSYLKERLQQLNALAAFEKSGHFYFAPPIGFGFDCGLRSALSICEVLNASKDQSLSDLHESLPKSWPSHTLSVSYSDEIKYSVVEAISNKLFQKLHNGSTIAGQKIQNINSINGVRVTLKNGAWILVRASSNTPNLVVVCESLSNKNELQNLINDVSLWFEGKPLDVH